MEESENPGIWGREKSGNGKWGIPKSGVKKLAAQNPVTELEPYAAFNTRNLVSYTRISGDASPTIWSCYANFSVFIDYKRESVSKEMNDNDLNLHSMTKSSGWLRY